MQDNTNSEGISDETSHANFSHIAVMLSHKFTLLHKMLNLA